MSNPIPTPGPLHFRAPDADRRDGLRQVADRASSPWSPRIARFMRRVRVTATCWLWTRRLDRLGYARTTIAGPRAGAHEASYRLFIGDIADGLEIDHLCRVRNCVRPDHLEAVTHQENMRRSRRRHANVTPRKPFCINGHAYTLDNTYWRESDGSYYCRECRKIENAQHRVNRRVRAANKAAAANAAPATVDALADATAAHLRLVGKWQPGTIAQLLADLPGAARLEQLVGGGR
jgi:hypothetical protein